MTRDVRFVTWPLSDHTRSPITLLEQVIGVQIRGHEIGGAVGVNGDTVTR